jgi:hypothetical protein
MGKECYCSSFDRKANYFSELSKIFEIIASSEFKDKGGLGGEEHTSILKCKKCGSYYIWNNSEVNYLDDDLVSARKYAPNVDDNVLKKILNSLDGIVSERKLDEHSKLRNKLKKIELRRDYERGINETKN